MRISKLFVCLLCLASFTACTDPSGEATDDLIELDETESDSDEVNQEDIEQEETIEQADLPLGDWKSYSNERFEFCVSYPANFLTPLGESENHDGNTFANANGSSEMRASGIYNALDETVKDAFERATENDRYYDEEKIISYKRQKDNWFVASGKYNESIFYVRTTLIEDTFYTLYFEYHSSEENKFSEIIKRNTRVFPNC